MKKGTILLAMVLFAAVISTKAQETVSAAGGEASGSGGSVSYTVGQVFYSTQIGTGGNTISQGVQQPYEISTVTGIHGAEGISLQFTAYPNPANGYLTVTVKDHETVRLQYLVFDLNGKLLQTVKATGAETKINTTGLVPGTYFVKVLDDQKEIKVFKVIKK